MRRAVAALVVTAVAVVLLARYETHPPRTVNPNSALRAQPTVRPGPRDPDARTATGPAIVTPFSVIQVQATVSRGRLTAVKTVALTGDGPHTDALNARAEPILREMGAPPIRTGPVGSAHAMKALNNYVSGAGLLAAAEAVHMAAALGLDTAVFTDVLNASSGRNVATETKLKSDVLTGRYAAGFQLGLMRKDLETAGTIAAETGFDAPGLSLCRDLWAQAVASLGPRVDNLEIHRFLGRREKAR